MASLKETRRRIQGVKNTQKITRAMKLVSSAKFARRQGQHLRAGVYGKELEQLVFSVCQGLTDHKLIKTPDKRYITNRTLNAHTLYIHHILPGEVSRRNHNWGKTFLFPFENLGYFHHVQPFY